MTTLHGRRVVLRPLNSNDFGQWQDVRRRNRDRLIRWEPRHPPGQADLVADARAFSERCSARHREQRLGTGYGFGVFVAAAAGGAGAEVLRGEMNLSSVQRGPFQSCYLGYWIDETVVGNGYAPEALVVVMRFAFEELRLHRVQAAIVPRNSASLRVVEKLGIRNEGLARRYIEINGEWEDHYRFAMTAEEWLERRAELIGEWISVRRGSTLHDAISQGVARDSAGLDPRYQSRVSSGN